MAMRKADRTGGPRAAGEGDANLTLTRCLERVDAATPVVLSTMMPASKRVSMPPPLESTSSPLIPPLPARVTFTCHLKRVDAHREEGLDVAAAGNASSLDGATVNRLLHRWQWDELLHRWLPPANPRMVATRTASSRSG
ncbi:Os03g0384050 [Oryza sativa Japonica Group]|uniref:Os03g0384050 protein n=2 Tax=Oryza sativa subsp. japonica TaxID=39947 RepID=B9F8R2_ORYSJ|nr:hypothetical protein OsJ_11079 [Oryza sativa Japonica Group]BAS84465.1 Os03g0384050 [Oryza sativa Japonica Group]